MEQYHVHTLETHHHHHKGFDQQVAKEHKTCALVMVKVF